MLRVKAPRDLLTTMLSFGQAAPLPAGGGSPPGKFKQEVPTRREVPSGRDDDDSVAAARKKLLKARAHRVVKSASGRHVHTQEHEHDHDAYWDHIVHLAAVSHRHAHEKANPTQPPSSRASAERALSSRLQRTSSRASAEPALSSRLQRNHSMITTSPSTRGQSDPSRRIQLRQADPLSGIDYVSGDAPDNDRNMKASTTCKGY